MYVDHMHVGDDGELPEGAVDDDEMEEMIKAANGGIEAVGRGRSARGGGPVPSESSSMSAHGMRCVGRTPAVPGHYPQAFHVAGRNALQRFAP